MDVSVYGGSYFVAAVGQYCIHCKLCQSLAHKTAMKIHVFLLTFPAKDIFFWWDHISLFSTIPLYKGDKSMMSP